MIRIALIALSLLFLSSPGQAEDSFSATYAGSWQGVGIQSGGGDWLVLLEISQHSARVDYPEFPCGGIWERTLDSGSHFSATERLEYGKKLCLDNSPVTLSRLSAGQLLAIWLDESGAELAIAVLHRNDPAQNDRAAEFSETSLTGMIRNLGLGPSTGCAVPMA